MFSICLFENIKQNLSKGKTHQSIRNIRDVIEIALLWKSTQITGIDQHFTLWNQKQIYIPDTI